MAFLQLTTIIVEDYDDAIAFFTQALGFELAEDSPARTGDGRPKRWVVVRPPGAETGILLARADGEHQLAAVGDQHAGRVGFFLRVDDFDAGYRRLLDAGVEFLTEPRTEPYGRVVVFRDIAGNRWDLLGPGGGHLAGMKDQMDIERRIPLRFDSEAVRSATHVNLSAVRTDVDLLWVAGDETATVERLSLTGSGEYARHATFALADVVALPGDADDEVDIEGLARNGPYLWAVGSHASKRKKVKPHHSDTKAVSRLARVTGEPSRRVLARLAIDGGAPVPETPEGHRSAALGTPGILDHLGDDDHLSPFLVIPGKDNGFDIEGIAVHGDPGAERLFLGLRGPVLRGWATVLEVAPREEDGALTLAPLDAGTRYRKHFLDLDGLGVRDLCRHGEDLLILAGPSMDLDGPVRVYRWRGAALIDASEVVHRAELHHELDLPYGAGTDHAEGIAVLPDDRLLVVYDSPDPARMPEPGTVLADVVRLPG